MRAVASLLTLPLRRHVWRGGAGQLAGAGAGSSIDFQDHRPYCLGDDPRHIDWLAYARSGQYSMKLYREEVSPQVDVAMDCSASMSFDRAKSARALELLYFVVESALAAGATLHCWLVSAGNPEPLPVSKLLAGNWTPEPLPRSSKTDAAPPPAPRLDLVPWRATSMRVLVSDLLFSQDAGSLLLPLTQAKGRALIFSPSCKAERDPDWLGEMTLHDCESSAQRTQHVAAEFVSHYKAKYARHFELWREQAARHGVCLAQISEEQDFTAALLAGALPVGAVELC